MEKKIKSFCYIRNIYQAINDFETKFKQIYNINFHEGIILCILKEKTTSSGELSKILNLSTSNTSKIIKIMEEKKLIKRLMIKEDRRKMFFTLTEEGNLKAALIKCDQTLMPLTLRKLLKNID